MKEALKILEDNFRLSSKDYIKLLGMLQELQQLREREKNCMLSSKGGIEK